LISLDKKIFLMTTQNLIGRSMKITGSCNINNRTFEKFYS
jgi:hypothetical protein